MHIHVIGMGIGIGTADILCCFSVLKVFFVYMHVCVLHCTIHTYNASCMLHACVYKELSDYS